uniref:Innexin n=1 Tax=Globodera rostochiensis TaxID=31243 RepID=A0A914IE22_GLORO
MYRNPLQNTTSSSGGRKQNSTEHGDWSRNLNKMINVHHLPFFGQSQAFMGKTLWDWIKKPRARFSDSIDRLNCNIVPSMLLFFVAMISANIFGFGGMEPMRCLRSAELNDEERDYALDYCTSKEPILRGARGGDPVVESGSPFAPAWLLPLGANHAVPAGDAQSGIEYTKFIEEATKLKSMGFAPIDERQEQISQLRDKLSEAILNRDPYRRIVGCRFGQSMGAYVSLLYICIKALYLINVATQFGVLNAFIGRDYRLWGFEVLKALINGENWQDSPIFPRLTLCDVPIRRLGDTPRYTLQCHLRINTYNEKIYLFIWWGFGAVALLTLVNFFYYLIVLLLLPCTQENSVRHLLKQDKHREIVYSESHHHRRLIRRFAEHALRKDGVLLFWFIEGHAGPIVARELMGELFEVYKTDVHEEEPPSEVSVADKKGKGSFSSQSTGSLDDEWGGGGGGGDVQFGNGGITPSAPPKFMPEASSFASSQERELIDGDGNSTEQTALYSSTPKQSHSSPASRNHQQHHHSRHNNRGHPYSADQRRRSGGGGGAIGGGGTGTGGGGGLLSSVFRRLGAAMMGTPREHSYTSASYYGRTPIKQV